MGNCCGARAAPTIQVALKLPHGVTGFRYDPATRGFISVVNLNAWVRSLYAEAVWTDYLAYNDEIPGNKKKTKGHCKGVLAWNTATISWLIHSVPNFPREFTGDTISDIAPSELVYGQSFCCIRYTYTEGLLNAILGQLGRMEVHLSHEKARYTLLPVRGSPLQVQEIQLLKRVYHVAKAPQHHIDIYRDYLCKRAQGPLLYVETWKRGSPLLNPGVGITDICHLEYKGLPYKETQDHAKWAVSDKWFFIGDLNRMESQSKRGGGGVLIYDPAMAKAFKSLIRS